MMDVLLRGRGANVGARAPGWLVRLCGGALALAAFALSDTIGVPEALGVPSWSGRLLALLVGMALAPTRAGSLLWLATGVLAFTACIASFTPLSAAFVHGFVRTDADRPGETLDAVVVLSGGMTDDGRITGAALDRLLSGVREARERRIPAVALSVIRRKSRGRTVTSEPDQRALLALIAPELELRFVRDVASTRDEALAFAALARTHGWHRVLLVTSPTHTRRACAAFETARLPVQCQPSQARDYSLARLELSENRRLAFADVLYETAATLLYRARAWIH